MAHIVCYSVCMTTTETLSAAALDVIPVDRDWSEGFGEAWNYIACPDCPECGETARWTDGRLACEHCGADEIESEDDGPMMSYAYPLPTGGRDFDPYDAAFKIAHLPLGIVDRDEEGFELVLTGGGMDLSWEICEAFICLGFLPPVHFCDLPRMSGYPERHSETIEACLRAVEIAEGRLARKRERLTDLRTAAA